MSKRLPILLCFRARILLVAVLLLSPTTLATALNRDWNTGSGNWSTGGNWTPTGVPAATDVVSIGFADNTPRTVTYDYTGLPVTLQSLGVDLSGLGAATINFNMPSNNLTAGVEYIGYFGRGTFNQTGGVNTVSSELHLGEIIGSNGSYTISNSAELATGTALVGVNGMGTLTIQDQAEVYVTNNLSINGSSTVNLNGGTLRFDSATGFNRINFNSGTLQVAGNQFLLDNGYIETFFGDEPLIPSNKGYTVEGVASLQSSPRTFRVAGGKLTIQSRLDVGYVLSTPNGDGKLEVTGGGILTTDSCHIGVDSAFNAPSGVVTVSGAGSQWANTTDLIVSRVANANLNVLAGGTVTSNNTIVGDASTRTGSVTVSGPGSMLTTSALNVGTAGVGTVTVADQGTVYVQNAVAINSLSSVNLEGGTLRFNTAVGLDRVNFASGTIQLAGDRSIGTDAAIKELFGLSATITAGKGLTVEQNATISSALTLHGGTLRTNNLIVNGSFYFGGGLLELTGGGTITGLASLAVPTGGEFRASGVQALRVTGAAGSTIKATGNLTLGNAAAVNGFGTQGTLQVDANSVTLLDSNDVVFDSLSLATLGSGASPGTLNAANGLTLDFGGNITGFGTVSTPNLLTKPLINNGHVTGTSAGQRITLPGYVKGVGTFDNVNFTGTISPGLSPTILTVGNIALSNTSTLIMELGGTAAGSGYDQIQSSGALALDGTLQVSLINGFTPTVGQSFNLFDWLSTSGTFDVLALPTLAGLTWNTSQLYTTGVLSLVTAAGVAGDYNQDGTVNAADYTVWRNNLGSATALPNDDTPGVGPDDYTRWKTHFGESNGGGGLAGDPTAIPEPTSFALVAVALGLLAKCRPIRTTSDRLASER